MVFILGPMARDEKRVVLRTVDDEIAREPEVVRLENRETALKRQNEQADRRISQSPQEQPNRLEVAPREERDLRTHQPGIEALVENEAFDPNFAEQTWGRTEERRMPIPWGWFVLIGLVIVTAAIWSLTHLQQSEPQTQSIQTKAKSVLANDEIEEAEARMLIEKIESALKSYFEASDVDSLARFVRQPERVKPLMQKHYAKQALAKNPMTSLRVLQPLTLDHYGNFWMSSVTLADRQVVNAVIEIDAEGKPLIDWETLVCYQPMPWDDFSKQRPTGESMDFRVYAERDNFYSHEFSNSDKWLCYRLTTPDSEETLFGYVSVESETARLLTQLTAQNPTAKFSLILRLTIPPGLQSRRGVIIEKIVCKRWLHIHPPDSGS